MMGLVGATVSFQEGSELLWELARVKVEAKQVERVAEALGREMAWRLVVDEVPYGPHKIAQNGQVVIPRDVLRRARLAPGESVYVTAHEGIVELVPASLVSEWLRKGRSERRNEP